MWTDTLEKVQWLVEKCNADIHDKNDVSIIIIYFRRYLTFNNKCINI